MVSVKGVGRDDISDEQSLRGKRYEAELEQRPPTKVTMSQRRKVSVSARGTALCAALEAKLANKWTSLSCEACLERNAWAESLRRKKSAHWSIVL
jgi:hypothetical protein